MEIMKIYASNEHALPIKAVADLLQQPSAKLHYHFKQLETAGYLKVVGTREINGITERFYQSTGLDLDICLSVKESPDAAAAIMPLIQRKTIAAIRRIQQLDSDNFRGIGGYMEVTYSEEKAAEAKSALMNLLKHQSARLPDCQDVDGGHAYDLIVLMVPQDESPDI